MTDWTTIKDLFWHSTSEPLLFHSGLFLFLFSIFLVGYAFVSGNKNARNIFIIVFSFYFYYMTSGYFLLLLVTTISLDYFFCWLIIKQTNERKRKLLVLVGILFSLSFLLYFKYKNFFLGNCNLVLGTHYKLLKLVLPIGISFYTFQSISFLVDTYKRKIALPKYSEYLMYMSFFPHLIAGPIVRAADFLPQAARKVSVSKENMNEAFFLISKGLIKKAIIGDFIAQYADIVFSQPEGFSGTEHLFATLCYTFQIFFDFSGYTDIAIGVALLLGFRLGVNFLSPYKSTSITEFWRRWHISLSSWLRDYIYIPLGGNNKGLPLQLLFLLVTMLIGGFWHGADWKFVFWGGAHGLLLVYHKLYMKIPGTITIRNNVFFKPFYWALTFSCVALLWIPFRAMSMSDSVIMYKSIFTDFSFEMMGKIAQNNPLLMVVFGIGLVLTLMPSRLKLAIWDLYEKLHAVPKFVTFTIIIQLIIQMRTADVHPFIYFDF
jgi:alginate O-acetyltransferase complex protein AlgI